MALRREIVTLQLGNYSNYVGSHLWSLQEMEFDYTKDNVSEICHDVLFREGLSPMGHVTFTPRVVCVEKKSRLPPLPIYNDNPIESAALWAQSGHEKVEPPEEHHQFIKDLNSGVDTSSKDYAFERTVRGWGDYMRTQLHPRSILVAYTNIEDELEDKIRRYVEECDNLQGFHIVTDNDPCYSDVLPFLADEFSSKYRLTLPVASSAETQSKTSYKNRIVETLSNYHESASHSSLTVPLSCITQLTDKVDQPRTFENVAYMLHDDYHTSSILAAFINTISLIYRASSNHVDITDAFAGLTSRGWKFSCASQQLPLAVPPGSSLHGFLESRDDEASLWSSLTPGADTVDSWYQTFSLRGFTDGSVFQQYLAYLSSTVSASYSIPSPMPTKAPFPKYFSPHVSTKGSVDPTASRMSGFEVNSIPVLSGLHIGPGVGEMLGKLVDFGQKIDIRCLPHIKLEQDLYKECLDNMKDLSKVHSNAMDFD